MTGSSDILLNPQRLADFRRKLLEWGKSHFRDFPWRTTSDPYRVLLAETLLHRTRASQVLRLYSEALDNFPTIEKLAHASPSELREVLGSAGLYWRIEKMRNMAEHIMKNFRGRVPRKRAVLAELPGVSDYIASAVVCFAFEEPEPLLDTNTVRILGRVFGLPVSDSSRRSRRFRTLMRGLIDPESPREFNFALLDLAAFVCLPREPLCAACPVMEFCVYGTGSGSR